MYNPMCYLRILQTRIAANTSNRKVQWLKNLGNEKKIGAQNSTPTVDLLGHVHGKDPNRTATFKTDQYRTLQHSTEEYSTAQHRSVQYSSVQHRTAQCSTAQYNTVQHSTVQYTTIQYSPQPSGSKEADRRQNTVVIQLEGPRGHPKESKGCHSTMSCT